MKPMFLDDLILKAVPPNRWETVGPFRYISFVNGSETLITVPDGFDNDLSSIPRAFRWLFTGMGRDRWAAVVHDWLYHVGVDDKDASRKDVRRSRKYADDVFLEALKAAGAPWYKRQMMYRAVRIGGAGSYG